MSLVTLCSLSKQYMLGKTQACELSEIDLEVAAGAILMNRKATDGFSDGRLSDFRNRTMGSGVTLGMITQTVKHRE